jgi:uncharacterized HAD superfamily protein
MKKILLCDIDGTICDDIKNENSHLYPHAQVIEGSLEQLNSWYDEGHHITFFTAREEKDREVTIKWLDDNGFKYHGLIMNKPRCLNPDDEGKVGIKGVIVYGLILTIIFMISKKYLL